MQEGDLRDEQDNVKRYVQGASFKGSRQHKHW